MTKVKNTMPRHRVENMFRDAANSAFRFVGLLKKHEKQNDIHEKRLEDIGGKLSPTWIIMSVVGLCAAIGLGIFAAFNAQGAIAGLIDPMGDNTVQPYVFFIVGASISIIGMIIGHFIHEGFTEGFQTDIHTGEKSPTPKLWLGVIGLVAAVVYVGYQFFLIKFAGDAAGVSKNNGPNYLPFIVAGIAILELIVGALILNRAFEYIVFFFASILLAFTLRQVYAAARNTNEYYRQYIVFVDAFNHENPGFQMEREGSPNIRKAIMYYSGIAHQPDNDDPENAVAEKTPPKPQPYPGRPAAQNDAAPAPETEPSEPNRYGTANHVNAEQAVSDFMNDTTEHDLTA